MKVHSHLGISCWASEKPAIKALHITALVVGILAVAAGAMSLAGVAGISQIGPAGGWTMLGLGVALGACAISIRRCAQKPALTDDLFKQRLRPAAFQEWKKEVLSTETASYCAPSRSGSAPSSHTEINLFDSPFTEEIVQKLIPYFSKEILQVLRTLLERVQKGEAPACLSRDLSTLTQALLVFSRQPSKEISSMIEQVTSLMPESDQDKDRHLFNCVRLLPPERATEYANLIKDPIIKEFALCFLVGSALLRAKTPEEIDKGFNAEGAPSFMLIDFVVGNCEKDHPILQKAFDRVYFMRSQWKGNENVIASLAKKLDKEQALQILTTLDERLDEEEGLAEKERLEEINLIRAFNVEILAPLDLEKARALTEKISGDYKLFAYGKLVAFLPDDSPLVEEYIEAILSLKGETPLQKYIIRQLVALLAKKNPKNPLLNSEGVPADSRTPESKFFPANLDFSQLQLELAPLLYFMPVNAKAVGAEYAYKQLEKIYFPYFNLKPFIYATFSRDD